MDKKGQAETEQFFLFIEIILGILVAGIFIYNAANFDALSSVNKEYAKQDLALLTETILASPGTVEYNYPLKASYNVKINEGITITTSSDLISAFEYENLIITKEQGSKTVTVERHA